MPNTLASILAGAGKDPYGQGTNLAPLIEGMLSAQNLPQGGGMEQQPMVPGQLPPGMAGQSSQMPSSMGQLGGMAGMTGMGQLPPLSAGPPPSALDSLPNIPWQSIAKLLAGAGG